MKETDQFYLIEKLKSGQGISDEPFSVPLTILIQTYNDAETITVCLKRLQKQNIIPNIIIFDTGSDDGTIELIETQIKNDIYYPSQIKLIKEKVKMSKTEKKGYVRHKIADIVGTKYIMFLTATVLIPPFSIPLLLEELETDPKLAMIGIKYEPNIPHVQMGATIMRTEIAKDIEWLKALQCGCRNARDQIIAQGLKVKHHNKLTAIHLLYGN